MPSLHKEPTGGVKFFSMSSETLRVAVGKPPITWKVTRGSAENNLHLNEHAFHRAMGEFFPLLILEPQPEVWSCVLSCKELSAAHAFWVKEDENAMLVPNLSNWFLSWERIVWAGAILGTAQLQALKQHQIQNEVAEEVLFCFIFFFEQESRPSLKISSVFFLRLISTFQVSNRDDKGPSKANKVTFPIVYSRHTACQQL